MITSNTSDAADYALRRAVEELRRRKGWRCYAERRWEVERRIPRERMFAWPKALGVPEPVMVQVRDDDLCGAFSGDSAMLTLMGMARGVFAQCWAADVERCSAVLERLQSMLGRNYILDIPNANR